MQFAVRYAKQPLDVVVSFAGKMPDNERLPLMACLQAACAALTAHTRSWWRSPASGAGFAPRAARGAWPRALRSWSMR